MTLSIDETDRKILALLQRDARMTNAAIATQVGMTAPSVFERIRKLEQRGVIRRYLADVDPAAVGKVLTAFIRLTAAHDDKYAVGLQAMLGDPDISECYHVAGEDCLIVKTRVSDPAELERLLNRIREQITVLKSVTMIALSALKEGGPINMDLIPSGAPPRKAGRLRK